RRVRWYHIGWVPLGDARRIADKLRVAVAEGRDPHGERRAERGADTFRMLADKYLREHAQRRNRSWKVARRLIEKHALPVLGVSPARSISRSEIKSIISKIGAPYTANSTLAALSAIFSFGVREELIEANPARGISKNPTRSRARVLSDSELPLIWIAL